MTVEYKVWITVERCDPDADAYEDVVLPDVLAIFDTAAKARWFMDAMLVASGARPPRPLKGKRS